MVMVMLLPMGDFIQDMAFKTLRWPAFHYICEPAKVTLPYSYCSTDLCPLSSQQYRWVHVLVMQVPTVMLCCLFICQSQRKNNFYIYSILIRVVFLMI